MTRFAALTTPSPRPPNITHKCVPSAHTFTDPQRNTSIDGAHLTPTKGVLSALIIEDASYHMDHICAETSDYHP